MREHRRAQGGGHRMAFDTTALLSVQDLSPPLQPDLTSQWVAHRLANARDFQVESVKCKQSAATLRRRKQGAQKALPVAGTNQHLAMCECIHRSPAHLPLVLAKAGSGFPLARG